MVIAKGLGGGYQPIGAMLISERDLTRSRDGSGAFQHGHTYLAHPSPARRPWRCSSVIRGDDLLASVRRMGPQLMPACSGGSATIRMSATSGAAACWALELVATAAAGGVRAGAEAACAGEARGVGARPAGYPMGGTIDGTRGDHVLLAPPYIVQPAEIDRIVAILGDAVDAAIASAS